VLTALGKRRNAVERAALISFRPPIPGSGLERHGEDAVFEGSGGFAVVVGPDGVGVAGGGAASGKGGKEDERGIAQEPGQARLTSRGTVRVRNPTHGTALARTNYSSAGIRAIENARSTWIAVNQALAAGR
jgi:hypothetical protein